MYSVPKSQSKVNSFTTLFLLRQLFRNQYQNASLSPPHFPPPNNLRPPQPNPQPRRTRRPRATRLLRLHRRLSMHRQRQNQQAINERQRSSSIDAEYVVGSLRRRWVCYHFPLPNFLLGYLKVWHACRKMPGNGDVVDKGLCCGDWCVIMENTAFDDIPYSRADVQKVDFTTKGGCSSKSSLIDVDGNK